MQKEFRALTLIEVLIIIIVVGILTALSLPQFSKTREHAIVKEATANLKLIAAAERIYRMEAGAYYPIYLVDSPVGSVDDINNNLRLSLTERNWDYSVETATEPASDFTAIAQRKSGPYSSCQYSINQSQDEPVVASGTCP